MRSRGFLCQRVVKLAVSQRFPLLVCLPFNSTLAGDLEQRLKYTEEVHALLCAGCAFGAKWSHRLKIWSVGTDSYDLIRLKTICTGARGYCSWSHKRHLSCIGIAFTVLHCRLLCRMLLRMFSVRVPTPDCMTATTHSPTREHPMLRG